jgi:hypothetical protein
LDKTKVCILTLLIIFAALISVSAEKEEAVIALPGHELGDSTFSLSAGLLIPLFFQDYNGFYPGNSSLGGAGSLHWSAYLTDSFRIGLEFGGAFSYDPNGDMYWMLPLTAKATYVFTISRFEIPISLGVGVDFFMYKDLFDSLIIVKPATGIFWRFDANLSFGLNISWWWNLETGKSNNVPPIMMNLIDISPVLFYHF